jgi:hypothetical protein
VTADEQATRSTARRAPEVERRGTCRRTLELLFMGDTKRGAFDADDLRAQRIAAAAKRFARHG